MSGSSPSEGDSSFGSWRTPTSSGTGNGGGGGVDKCAIVERTILASPDMNIVNNLIVGQDLLLELETGARQRVVAKTSQGEVAGAITAPSLIDMIECMKSGYTYVAVILAVDGGQVNVEIHPA